MAVPLWFLIAAYRDSLPMALNYPGRLDITAVCWGYIVALASLLIGGLLQSLIARRGDAFWTLAFFGVGLLLFGTLSPLRLIGS